MTNGIETRKGERLAGAPETDSVRKIRAAQIAVVEAHWAAAAEDDAELERALFDARMALCVAVECMRRKR